MSLSPGKKWLRSASLVKGAAICLILTLAAIAVLVRISVSQAGENNKVNWISFDQAQKEAQKTGKPIFVFFHFRCNDFDRVFYGTFSDPTFVGISREFLCVEVPVVWAPGGRKGDLAGMGSLARYNPQHLTFYGVFLDPEGKIFERKYLDCSDPDQFGDWNPSHYTGLLFNILIRYSCWLGPKALKEGKFSIASHRFQVILKYAEREDNRQLAQTGIAQLEKIGAQRLQKAQEIIEAKKYLEAYEALALVKEDFQGLAPAQEAEKQMAQLDGDPVIKKEMDRARLDRKARPHYDRAVKYEEQGRHYLAYMTYKSIVECFADCSSGDEAAARIKEMEADPALMKTIKAEEKKLEAKKTFEMAENLEKNGLIDKALIYYQKLLDEFPDSYYAKKAREKIEELSSY
jgi:hypothetical protein